VIRFFFTSESNLSVINTLRQIVTTRTPLDNIEKSLIINCNYHSGRLRLRRDHNPKMASMFATTQRFAVASATDGALTPQFLIDYISPVSVAIAYFGTLAVRNWCAFSSRKPSSGKKTSTERRVAIGLLSTAIFGYVIQALVYLTRSLLEQGWWAPQHRIINVLASILVWGGIFVKLVGEPTPSWLPYSLAWMVGFGFETIICALSTPLRETATIFDIVAFAAQCLRVTCFLLLGIIAICLLRKADRTVTPGESQSLLGAESAVEYGAIATENPVKTGEDAEQSEDEDKDIKEQQRKRLEEQGGWWGYLKGFMVFAPYIWPTGNRKVQACLAFMFVHVVFERFLNVLVPRQVGIITNRLAESSTGGPMPWRELLVWVFLKYLGSSAGLSMMRTIASAHVSNNSTKRLSGLAFKHVMGLSMDFHSNKDSGEVLKSVDQARSLTDLLETIGFDTGPMMIDMVVALFYITHLFDVYVAFVVLVVGVVYVSMAFKLTEYTQPKRRLYTEKSRFESKTLYESVSNWQTVSYFNRIPHEEERYQKTVDATIEAQLSYFYAWSFCYAAQSIVMTLGLLTAAFIAIYQISSGSKPVGNFVTFVMYWGTMMGPLNRLTWTWKHVNTTLVDAERLLQLVQTKSSVQDVPGAPDLEATQGRVEFKNVDFSYDDRKQTIKDLSFTVEPGQTVALVGETGGGKSSTLKLLMRFYDLTNGSINIDGQNIQDVTLSSLRETLGTVPQDPSLFNTSIMENVRYARLDATDEEVMDACRAAAVHEKIITFPDQYKSKVGERGVKLSGGELQRIAIARVILKNPKIVLLDEATSAVDSSIETQIQSAFKKLSAGRTTFVVAHRLSTIMDANVILVIDQGSIIQRGTHEELIQIEGEKYHELWSKQTARSVSKASSVTAGEAGDEDDKTDGNKLIDVD
jgi:ABC-type transport system involved in Fe-S cluster assembly fused permease/ATPase subunit